MHALVIAPRTMTTNTTVYHTHLLMPVPILSTMLNNAKLYEARSCDSCPTAPDVNVYPVEARCQSHGMPSRLILQDTRP